MGLADRGSLSAGRRADLVALDRDQRVIAVWQGGVPLARATVRA
jgi:N-acetylglucosamine-6-phosphate deacetylase